MTETTNDHCQRKKIWSFITSYHPFGWRSICWWGWLCRSTYVNEMYMEQAWCVQEARIVVAARIDVVQRSYTHKMQLWRKERNPRCWHAWGTTHWPTPESGQIRSTNAELAGCWKYDFNLDFPGIWRRWGKEKEEEEARRRHKDPQLPTVGVHVEAWENARHDVISIDLQAPKYAIGKKKYCCFFLGMAKLMYWNQWMLYAGTVNVSLYNFWEFQLRV